MDRSLNAQHYYRVDITTNIKTNIVQPYNTVLYVDQSNFNGKQLVEIDSQFKFSFLFKKIVQIYFLFEKYI